MRIGGKIIAASVGLALAACTSAPTAETPRDASFTWGCWVAKDQPGGRIHGFLRLLKDGPDGKLYQGYLHDVRGSDMIPLLHLSLARDGSGATVVRDGRTTDYAPSDALQIATPDKTPRLELTSMDGSRLSLTGGEDYLGLTIQTGDHVAMFEFERDGCD